MDFGRGIMCQQDRIHKKVAECGWKGKALHVIYEWKDFQKWFVTQMWDRVTPVP